MVRVPFGDDGALIVLGGAQYHADLWMVQAPESAPNDFMTKVAVYDIHQDAWYLQETNGGKEGVTPRQLSAFCTVTTAPDDGSSLSIYVYGGYDGGYGNANDEVWVCLYPRSHGLLFLEERKTTDVDGIAASCHHLRR